MRELYVFAIFVIYFEHTYFKFFYFLRILSTIFIILLFSMHFPQFFQQNQSLIQSRKFFNDQKKLRNFPYIEIRKHLTEKIRFHKKAKTPFRKPKSEMKWNCSTCRAFNGPRHSSTIEYKNYLNPCRLAS